MKTLFRFSLSASLILALAAKHVEESKVSKVEGDGGRDRNNVLDELWIRRKTRDLGEKKNYKKMDSRGCLWVYCDHKNGSFDYMHQV